MKNGLLLTDTLVRRFTIGHSILLEFKSNRTNKNWIDEIKDVDGVLKWSLSFASPLAAALPHAKLIQNEKTVQKKYQLEIPVGDQFPETNKAYLIFDASDINQAVELGS